MRNKSLALALSLSLIAGSTCCAESLWAGGGEDGIVFEDTAWQENLYPGSVSAGPSGGAAREELPLEELPLEELSLEEMDPEGHFFEEPEEGGFGELSIKDLSIEEAVSQTVSSGDGDVYDGTDGYFDGFSIEEDDLLAAPAGDPFERRAEELGDGELSIEEEDLISGGPLAREDAPAVGDGYVRLSVVVSESDWAIKNYGFKLRRKGSAEAVYAARERGLDVSAYEDDLALEEAGLDDGGFGEGPEEVPPVGLSYDDMFYTEKDGVVRVTTVNSQTGISHTGYYIFDANGKMLTGRRSLRPGTPGQAYDYTSYKLCMFTPTNIARLYDEYQGQDLVLTPLNSDIGQRKDDYWYWEEAAGKFQYYDNNGNRYPMNELNDLYASVGYHGINGAYYQLMSSGRPRTGLREINGSRYYFFEDSEIPGQMALGQWVLLHGKTGRRYLYFLPESAGEDKGKAVLHRGFHTVEMVEDGQYVKYLLNKNGYVIKERMMAQGEDGKVYCSDGDGRIYQNTFVYNGNDTYYAGTGGALFQTGSLTVDGKTYVFENYVMRNSQNLREDLLNNFKVIHQHPELPTGCEITSLTMTLNYYGFDVDKLYMADYYLPKGDIGTVNFWYSFVGNPRTYYSYGCYAPCIVKAANDYLGDHGSGLRARSIIGQPLVSLFQYIDQGIPVIIWGTMNCVQGYYSTTWEIDGETITWYACEHCLVLIGYDDTYVYLADPDTGDVSVFTIGTFERSYNSLYKQAVILE